MVRQSARRRVPLLGNGSVGPIAGLTGVKQTYHLLPKLDGGLWRHHLSAVPVGQRRR